MPESGPGRNSLKKMKKKNQIKGGNVSSTTSAGTAINLNAQIIEDNRLSSAVKDTNFINDDAIAMQKIGDEVDEYYYGLRIFPGQGNFLIIKIYFLN